MTKRFSLIMILAMGCAHIGVFGAGMAMADDRCALVDGALPEGCRDANAGTVVRMPSQPNAPSGRAPVTAPTGFVISVNDRVLTGDRTVANVARRADVVLADADVEVIYDGLEVTPRLDLEILGPPRTNQAGDLVRLQSELNYPKYVTRGEVRVVDMRAVGGPALVEIVPLAPNGTAQLRVPDGRELVVVYRVYDASGRYNETAPVPLTRPDNRPEQNGAEMGSDITAYRGIPIYGGSVTVRGDNVTPGARVQALGETVRTDGSGRFVIQRIMPTGEYDVSVNITGPRQRPLNVIRRVDVPAHELFYMGALDVTVGRQHNGRTGRTTTYKNARAGIYVDGRTANGFKIRISADTDEGPIDQMFRRLQEKDPRGYALRLDPNDLYPSLGDSSTTRDNTPTSGRIFARIERDGNYIQWGDFRANLDGSELLRNDRALYGLSAGARSRHITPEGEARARAEIYVAQPDMLPARDVFTGTGGAVYFLSKQDIGQKSEMVLVQLRDPVTERVLRTVRLRRGADYRVNYIQGVVTLNRPLSSFVSQGGVVGGQGTDPKVLLITQYEYRPTSGDVDGFAAGGRGEIWLSNSVRLGYSAMVEQTQAARHSAQAVDVMWRHSADTYAKLEVARSEGPGFGYRFSADGGLTVKDEVAQGGTGTAVKFAMRAGLRDMGIQADGAISGYFERRGQGFSSLDYQVGAATGDETLWGVSGEYIPSEALSVAVHYDDYRNTAGAFERKGGAEMTYQITPQWGVDLGIEHVDKRKGKADGHRTDVAAKLTYKIDEKLSVYGFAQGTVSTRNLRRTDRVGAGLRLGYDNGWTLEAEVSSGAGGWGTRLLASYENAGGDTQYLGYELAPGRELPGVTLDGRDQGRVIAGGRRNVSDSVSVFGENSYDMFGKHRSLASAYGMTYEHSDALSGTIALEFGQIDDKKTNDFTRRAISLAMKYETKDLSFGGRFEYRHENGLRAGRNLMTHTLGLSADLRYRITEGRRLIASFNLARTQSDQTSVLNGDFTEVVLGYSLRPRMAKDLTLFARYRYLSDMHGQQLNTTDRQRAVQRSHVFSIDGQYALSPRLSLGAKLGVRLSETAPKRGDVMRRNDAWLGVLNAQYHLVHKWDAQIELRRFSTIQGATDETGALVSVYRHLGNHTKLGVGYNFTKFSDDLTDLTHDNYGPFINLTVKF